MMWSLIIMQLPGCQTKFITISWLLIYNIFQAIGDVVGDAIMVTCARKDPVHGSSDLQMVHIVSVWLGGISGSVISSYANENFHPFIILRGFWVTSILFSILAFWIEEIHADKFSTPIENVKLSLRHIQKRIVFGSLIFLFISGAIIPSFSDIMYFWQINVLEFSKQTIALLTLISFWTASLGTFIYKFWLKNIEYRCIMILAHFIFAFASLTSFLLVSRISKNVFGLNDIFFSFFTGTLMDVLYVAFVLMPTLVLQTKIVPKNIEATVYSFFTSLLNLANTFISPIIGGIISDFFHVSKDDFTYLPTIILIQLAMCFIPILFIWLLPTNKDIDDYYEEVVKYNSEDQDSMYQSLDEVSMLSSSLLNKKGSNDPSKIA